MKSFTCDLCGRCALRPDSDAATVGGPTSRRCPFPASHRRKVADSGEDHMPREMLAAYAAAGLQPVAASASG